MHPVHCQQCTGQEALLPAHAPSRDQMPDRHESVGPPSHQREIALTRRMPKFAIRALRLLCQPVVGIFHKAILSQVGPTDRKQAGCEGDVGQIVGIGSPVQSPHFVFEQGLHVCRIQCASISGVARSEPELHQGIKHPARIDRGRFGPSMDNPLVGFVGHVDTRTCVNTEVKCTFGTVNEQCAPLDITRFYQGAAQQCGTLGVGQTGIVRSQSQIIALGVDGRIGYLRMASGLDPGADPPIRLLGQPPNLHAPRRLVQNVGNAIPTFR